jgi:uncharacterized protein (TIGR03000 family)
MSKLPRLLAAALLAGAALLLLPGPGQAQRGFRRSIALRRAGPYFPPNRMPGWDNYFINPYSPYNYGRNPYNPIPYPYPYPYVNPYPWYGGYAYGGYGNDPTAGWPSPGYDSGTEMVPHATGPVKDVPPDAAVIKLTVPDRFADVWMDGHKTSSVGTTRYYVTPVLPKGQNFTYVLRVRWNQDGATRTAARVVSVRDGQMSVVNMGPRATE